MSFQEMEQEMLTLFGLVPSNTPNLDHQICQESDINPDYDLAWPKFLEQELNELSDPALGSNSSISTAIEAPRIRINGSLFNSVSVDRKILPIRRAEYMRL